MKILNYLLSVLFFVSINFCLNAQEIPKDTTLRLVEKNDGTKYIAKILSDDGRELLIQTEALGKIYIPKSEIKRIALIEDTDEIVDGDWKEESPFSTRYAFTNNALPIKANNHYAMVNLFGPEIHFAVSDRLNIGVMTTWIASPMVFVGKYTIPTSNPKVNFSIASMLGTSGYLNSFGGFGGLHWGTFTYGDRKNNISFSAGYGYFNSDLGGEISTEDVPGEYFISDSNTYIEAIELPQRQRSNFVQAPIFSVAGIFQITSKASLFFDSMFGISTSKRTARTTEEGGWKYLGTGNVPQFTPYHIVVSETSPKFLYFMPGMRFQKDEKRAFQIALAGVTVWQDGDNVTFPLPLLSWFYKF